MAREFACAFQSFVSEGGKRVGLGMGGEYRGDSDIVDIEVIRLAHFVHGLHRQADYLVGAQQASGYLIRHVALTYVYAVGVYGQRNVHAVIDQERHTAARQGGLKP